MGLNVIALREHNRVARALAEINLQWNDETIFQTARAIVIGEFQHISFNEMLPLYVRESLLYLNKILFKTDGYVDDYGEKVNPNTFAPFAHGSFRQGHSFVAGELE